MVLSSTDDCKWILDSGCSFHMTPNGLWFQKFIELEKGFGKRSCKITGFGKVKFCLHDATKSMVVKIEISLKIGKRNMNRKSGDRNTDRKILQIL